MHSLLAVAQCSSQLEFPLRTESAFKYERTVQTLQHHHMPTFSIQECKIGSYTTEHQVFPQQMAKMLEKKKTKKQSTCSIYARDEILSGHIMP